MTAAMLIGTSTPVLAASSAADGLEPSAAQALGVVEYAFFIGAGIAGASLLAATGMLAIRMVVLPTWLGWKPRHRPPDADHHRPHRVHRNRHRPPALGARCQHSALQEERHRFLVPAHLAA